MPAPATKAAPANSSDAIRLKHFQTEEKKALDKLERIKTWPKEHQKEAQARAEAKLSHIRDEMKKLVK